MKRFFPITALLGLVFSAHCLADVRPEALRNSSETGAAEAGRELLRAAMEKAGLRAWQKYTTATVEVDDTWNGIGALIGPWPENPQKYRQDFLLGTFTSRVELLSGSKRGTVYGMQNWKNYTTAGAGTAPEYEENADMFFLLPTLQYFFEFPFRIDSADTIVAAGERTLHGVSYDLVFATWGGLQPDDRVDQYLIYIDHETGLIRKLRYTVRESGSFFAGTMHYDDFRSTGGVLMPHRQTITLDAPEDIDSAQDVFEDNLHDMIIASMKFDVVRADELTPFAGGGGGDYKP